MEEYCQPKVITVAALNRTKSDTYSILQDERKIHVKDAVFIRILSKVFHVPYKVLIPSDGEWGRKLPDGNWTGLIGMVHRSEADLAVGGITLTHERFQALNFSYPYLFTDMTFITDKMKPIATSSALFYPFSWKLWILIIIAFFTFLFLFFHFILKKETFQSVLVMLFGSLFGQSIRFKAQKISHRLIFIMWLVFIFVLTYSYKGVILSFMTFPSLSGIRDIQDLAKAAQQNSVTCYIDKGHALTQVIFDPDIEAWKSVGKCLTRGVVAELSDIEKRFMEAPSKKVFFGGRISKKKFEKNYLISEDSFFKMMYALPISQKFSCKEEINKFIHRFTETGVFAKIYADEHLQNQLKSVSNDSNESHIPKALQIADLKGAFIILISGNILASITLFIEIVVKCCFSERNCNSLSLSNSLRLK